MNMDKLGYRITTDNMTDLGEQCMRELGIETISLSYTLEGKSYDKTNSLPPKEFFDRMRAGATPTSSQFNPEDAVKVFEEVIEKYDQDILHISFSSGLSGSCASAFAGAKLAMERHPGRRVIVVDSLCASLGQGYLLTRTLKTLEEQPMGIDELKDWLEATKLHIGHLVTVDDMIYLYRGGRISRTAAFVSGVLDIKPMIHLDNDGKLTAYGKVRTRRKALLKLVDDMATQSGNRMTPDLPVYICHGDCLKDAEFVRDQIKQRFGTTEFVIEFVGPTIGLHTGPGLVAIFFMADYR